MFVTEFYRRTLVPWSPVIIRGVLWVAIAVLSDLRHDLQELTVEKLHAMTWLHWLNMVVGMFLSGAIAMRLFMDQSISTFNTASKADAAAAQALGKPS
jgi:hypothetical protein